MTEVRRIDYRPLQTLSPFPVRYQRLIGPASEDFLDLPAPIAVSPGSTLIGWARLPYWLLRHKSILGKFTHCFWLYLFRAKFDRWKARGSGRGNGMYHPGSHYLSFLPESRAPRHARKT